MAFEAVKTAFFHSPAYAVVGASKDQTKYGTKVRQIAVGDQIFS